MTDKFKPNKALLIGLCCLSAMTQSAFSQATQYSPKALVLTNGVAWDGSNTNAIIQANSATNIYQVISSAKYGDVGLQMSFKLQAAGTSAVSALIDFSGDGTNWVPGYATLSANAAGTSTASCFTNITTGPMGFLRVAWVTNGNNAILTNMNFRVIYKPVRFGS